MTFRRIQLGWGKPRVYRLTRLGKWISVLVRRASAWSKSLPQRKGYQKCSQFLLLPPTVTCIQRKKKKNDKMSIPWLEALEARMTPFNSASSATRTMPHKLSILKSPLNESRNQYFTRALLECSSPWLCSSTSLLSVISSTCTTDANVCIPPGNVTSWDTL